MNDVGDKNIVKALKDFDIRNEKTRTDKAIQSEVGRLKGFKECYGRILCRALALKNGLVAGRNADSLTFFALDAWMLAQKGMTAEQILKLA